MHIHIQEQELHTRREDKTYTYMIQSGVRLAHIPMIYAG